MAAAMNQKAAFRLPFITAITAKKPDTRFRDVMKLGMCFISSPFGQKYGKKQAGSLLPEKFFEDLTHVFMITAAWLENLRKSDYL